MRDAIISTSAIEGSVSPEPATTKSRLPYIFAASVLKNNAERWGRRAQFYERFRDYFPRLSSGGFVARCRELEASYRGLSLAVWNMTPQVAWVPVRSTVRRIR